MIVDLHLKGNLVLVVGGGAEGLKKVNSLVTQDCKILLISDKINNQISGYVKKKKIKFEKNNLKNANFLSKYKPYLVMATTNDKKLNQKIVKKAKTLGCLVYASDDPKVSDFAHPSVINIEDSVQVAVSTGGKSPAIARKIRLDAEKIFKKVVDKEKIQQIKLQQIARILAKQKISTQSERKKFLYAVINDAKIKQLIKDDHLNKAQNRIKQILKGWK